MQDIEYSTKLADLKRSFYEQYYKYNQITMGRYGDSVDKNGDKESQEAKAIHRDLEYILSAFLPNLKNIVQDPSFLNDKDPIRYRFFSVGKTFKGSLTCFPSSTIHYGDVNQSKNVKASYFLTVAPKEMQELPNTATQFHLLAIAQLYDGFMGNVFLATLWTLRRFDPFRHFYYVGKEAKIKHHCSDLLKNRNFDEEEGGPWIGTILALFLKDLDTWLKAVKKPMSTAITSDLLDEFYDHDIGMDYVDFRDNIDDCTEFAEGAKMFSA